MIVPGPSVKVPLAGHATKRQPSRLEVESRTAAEWPTSDFVEKQIMRVQIDSHARLQEEPQSLYCGERRITVVEVIDRWYGPRYRYVKVKGHERNVYILRFDQSRDRWDLIMFSSERAPRLSTGAT